METDAAAKTWWNMKANSTVCSFESFRESIDLAREGEQGGRNDTGRLTHEKTKKGYEQERTEQTTT